MSIETILILLAVGVILNTVRIAYLAHRIRKLEDLR
jgi:hypothetical protein